MRTQRERIRSLLAQCYDRPELFNSVFLRRPPFWWRQVEIGRSVARYKTTVVVSCNSAGKDYAVGSLVPWWLWTRHRSLVYVTGPSQTVLGSVTWKEVRRALSKPRFPMRCRISEGTKASPLRVEIDRLGWGALGFSTTSVERASGQHEENLFVIVEEASSADDDTKAAIRGLNPAKLLLIGNPIRSEGWFREMADRGLQEAGDPSIPDEERVNTIRISAFDSPDIELLRSPRGLADRGFLNEAKRDYGEGSLWWRSHVLAIFPDVNIESLFEEGWLDLAFAFIHPAHADGGRARMGIDLGNGVGADGSAIVVRDNLRVLDLWEDSACGLPETAHRAQVMAIQHRVPHDRISYDAAGIGQKFAAHLAGNGITKALPYYGAGRLSKRFANNRTFGAFLAMRRLHPNETLDPKPDRFTGVAPKGAERIKQPQFSMPPHPLREQLRKELLALRYELTGAVARLEDKEQLKARLGGRSPNLVDAFTQTFVWGD